MFPRSAYLLAEQFIREKKVNSIKGGKYSTEGNQIPTGFGERGLVARRRGASAKGK